MRYWFSTAAHPSSHTIHSAARAAFASTSNHHDSPNHHHDVRATRPKEPTGLGLRTTARPHLGPHVGLETGHHHQPCRCSSISRGGGSTHLAPHRHHLLPPGLLLRLPPPPARREAGANPARPPPRLSRGLLRHTHRLPLRSLAARAQHAPARPAVLARPAGVAAVVLDVDPRALLHGQDRGDAVLGAGD